MGWWRLTLVASTAAVVATFATSSARADDDTTVYPPLTPRAPMDGAGIPYPAVVTSGDAPARVFVWLESGVRYEARGGSFQVPAVSSFLREMPSASVGYPMGSTRWALGFHLGVSIGNFVIPVGVELSGSTDQTAAAFASVDGTSGRLLGSTLHTTTLFPGGIGYRARTRRLVAGITALPFVDLRYVDAELAVGGATQKATASAVTVGVRADLAVCPRLESWAALCAFMSPDIVGTNALHGFLAGLRMEVGE